MNPDRLVARLAGISALNNYMDGPYPTLAGPMIFDSRIEPMEDFKQDQIFPLCVVYTDYEKDHWQHHTVNATRDRLLTVTFELLVAQISEIPATVDGAGNQVEGGFVIEYPNTDSEIETTLDIFEIQVVEALAADNVAADCWRYLMSSYENVISRRGATVEGGTKLAARQVTIEAKVPRGPVKGIIPPSVAAFLDRLEQHADYAKRVPAIRSIYTGAAALTSAEQLLRTMGWTTEAGRILGYARGPQVVLPNDVVFTDQNGNPLP